MALSPDLISQFAKLTNNENKKKSETTVRGTFKTIDGEEFVQIDGSDIWTPVTSTVEAETGERVTVLIKDHTATVTGNITSPTARTKTVENLKDEVDEYGNTIKQLDNTVTQQNNSIIQINNSIKQQNDTINSFGNTIDSQNNKIQEFDNTIKQQGDTITSMNNTISSQGNQITSINNTVEQNSNTIKQHGDTILSQGNTITQQGNTIAQQGNTIEQQGNTIEQQGDTITSQGNTITQQGNIINQQGTKIETMNSDITILNSGFKIENGVLTGLSEIVVNELETNTLNTKYANIDFSNIGEAAVEKLFSDSGIIKDLVMNDGQVTGELVGVTIKGDLIEGNTLKADKLVILGTDGLYYKLNVNALGETTASSDEKYQNGLDGSIIVAESITAEKIAVTDLVAFGATIGGFNITNSAIYSGAKGTVNNTLAGVYQDKEGQFAVGDNVNFVKFYKDQNGKYKLEISADNISFGTEKKTVESLYEAVNSNSEDLTAYIESTNKELESLQGQIDGSIMTWFYEYVPTNANLPASEWNTTDLKNNHLGDLFYDTITGYCYRWQVQNNQYSWNRITDVDVTKALADAKNAQDTADSKRRVFTSTPTTPYDVGDLWVQGASGDIMKCRTAKTKDQSYSAADWEKASKYTDDTAVNALGTRVTTAETKINQNSEAIELRATKTEVTNQINAVNTNLSSNYYNKTETDAKIKVESDRITSTVNKITTIETAVDETNTKIDNLEIGGRNLLPDTDFNGESKLRIEPEGGTGEGGFHFVPVEQIESGIEYTLSARIRGTADVVFYQINEGGNVSHHWIQKSDLSDTVYQDYSITFTVDTSHTFIDVYICTRYGMTAAGEWFEIEPSSLKLEKGNKATDWTPAPEDMNSDISNAQTSADAAQTSADSAQETANSAQSTVQQLSDMISHLVTDANGGSLMTQTADGWTFNMGTISGNLNAIEEAMDTMKDDQDDTNDALQKLSDLVDSVVNKTAYITLSTDDNGDPCIELGKTDNDFKVRITNTAIDFLEGSSKIAYANNNTFYSTKIIVKNELQIGEGPGFAWRTRANGNMGLVYISN